jgi:hypothetical protein
MRIQNLGSHQKRGNAARLYGGGRRQGERFDSDFWAQTRRGEREVFCGLRSRRGSKKKRGPYAGQGAGAQNIRRKRTKLWLRHSFIPEFINLSFYALLPEVLAKIGAFLTPLRFIL